MSAQPVSEEVWSIGRLLDWTQQFFGRKRLESPRLDAELLLAHVLGCSRIQLYTHYEIEVSDADRTRYKELVRRRSLNEPVAYLTGVREFYGLPFSVSRDVLIPRPETEHLVDAAIAFMKGREKPAFVDVGVGSGCIAVALAAEVPSATGVGIDACTKALRVATENAARNGVGDRLQFVESDLFANLKGREFDLVVSNPPYVTTAEWGGLSADVKNWEPQTALLGGDDGLEVYRRLIPQAAEHLKPRGQLMLEIGSRQEGEILALIGATPLLRSVATVKDYSGHPRVVAAERAD